MKITRLIILCGLLGFTLSCSSQNKKETQLILNETKREIKGYIDSTNYYFDLVLSDHKRGIDNSTIEKKYGKRIEELETSIDQALNKTNKLGEQGKITEKEYQNWMQEININSVMEKHQKIKYLGINFDELPVTNIYSLTQIYNDPDNRFSISFPSDWTIVPNYNQFTLMGAGPISIGDSSQGMKREGGFGLDINEYDKDFTTEQYYNGNLNSIRKGYSNFMILEEKDINLNGINAKYIAHQASINGKEVTSIQIYFFKDKKGYILNGSALSDYYNMYRDMYIEIAKTFKLNER